MGGGEQSANYPMPFIKAVTVKALAGREGRALVLAGQKQGLGALGPIARRVSAWRTVRRPGALQTTAATSRHMEEGAGQEGDGPALSLTGSCRLLRTGGRSLPASERPPPSAARRGGEAGRPPRILQKGRRLVREGREPASRDKDGHRRSSGPYFHHRHHRRAPARNPVATHTCPRKTSLARWTLNAPAGRGPRLRVAHAA